MTNGSSQGLFVIVAVVIFGIFVVISYLLFRDKLQTGLASIFTDSISETSNSTIPFNNGSNLVTKKYISKIERNGDEFTLYKESTIPTHTWAEGSPVGLSFEGSLEIPYGYTLEVKFEMSVHDASEYVYDMNAYNKNNMKAFPSIHSDSYADGFGKIHPDNLKEVLTPEKWTECYFSYNNDSIKNTGKIAIHDYSIFGIRYSAFKTSDSYKIRNIQYRIVKIQEENK